MVKDDAWWEFIRQCAADVIAGQLTAQHLRQALKNPRLGALASRYDFRRSLVKVCEETSPRVTHHRSLMLEINAADRRFQQLFRSKSRIEGNTHTESSRLRVAQ